MAKLAALCLEHGIADSNFTTVDQRKVFIKCAAVLYYKAEKAKRDVEGVVHMFNKRKAEAMLSTFVSFGIENDHEFLDAAVDSFGKALKSIECTFLPEVWLGKATAQEVRMCLWAHRCEAPTWSFVRSSQPALMLFLTPSIQPPL